MQIYDMEYIKTIKNYIKREDIHSQKTNIPVISLNDYIDLVLNKYYGKVCKDYKCRQDWKEWKDEIKRKLKELFQNKEFISKLLDKIPFDKSKINFDELNKLLDDVSKSLDEVNDIQLVTQNDSIAMIRKK